MHNWQHLVPARYRHDSGDLWHRPHAGDPTHPVGGLTRLYNVLMIPLPAETRTIDVRLGVLFRLTRYVPSCQAVNPPFEPKPRRIVATVVVRPVRLSMK